MDKSIKELSKIPDLDLVCFSIWLREILETNDYNDAIENAYFFCLNELYFRNLVV